jgi:hypothetical protein
MARHSEEVRPPGLVMARSAAFISLSMVRVKPMGKKRPGCAPARILRSASSFSLRPARAANWKSPGIDNRRAAVASSPPPPVPAPTPAPPAIRASTGREGSSPRERAHSALSKGTLPPPATETPPWAGAAPGAFPADREKAGMMGMPVTWMLPGSTPLDAMRYATSSEAAK